ncbi:uncharacterized protein METZ01_LOCUS322361, partial [marine metagenome]
TNKKNNGNTLQAILIKYILLLIIYYSESGMVLV